MALKKQKLYAYIIEWNQKSNNPSYDIRFYQTEQPDSHFPGLVIRAPHLDSYIEIYEKCPTCKK